jgi:hypothetical protein
VELDYLPQTMSDEDLKNGVHYNTEDYDPTVTDVHPAHGENITENQEIIMLQLIQQHKNKKNKNGRKGDEPEQTA